MNFSNINFGYDEYNPVDYYRILPEDINPAIKSGYQQKVADYYSEPPASRFRTKHKYQKKCNCANHGIADRGFMNGNTLNILVIILIVITVIQWIIIFWSGNSSVVINNINNRTPDNPPITEGGDADLLNNVI
jgi:hypothetical protein